MYCPNCSQSNLSDELQFCPVCSNRLDDKDRTDAEKAKMNLSPRQKGIRQGIILILLSLSLVPAYFLLAPLFPANDTLIESHVSDTPFEQISQAILWMLFSLGLVRLIYARFFQMDAGHDIAGIETATTNVKGATSANGWPLAQRLPTSGFGLWRTDSESEEAILVAAEHTKVESNEKS